MQIAIDEILIKDGRRELDKSHVHELAESIRELGLLNPITIDQENVLIAGLHRIEAVKALGWTEITCTISSLEGLQAELAEIDENIVRSDLSVLDYGEMLLRRKEIYEQIHPETRHGGDRKSEEIKAKKIRLDPAKSFVQDTAQKLKVVPRTVELQVQTAKNLTPETKEIIRDWDERLLDPVIVSFRDGKFYVIDGQHRIAAMRKMNNGSEVMAVCKVYSGLTYEQEADLCYKLDKAKRRLSLSQSTNALAESGTDAEITEIKYLVEHCGFVWALGKSRGKTGEIVSTRALINAYHLLGRETFTRFLTLLQNTWEGDPRSLTAAIISGTALFVKTYETEMNDHTFLSRLSAVDPDEINRRGRADFSTGNVALRFARVILEKYNGQRGGKKLPYRFKG